MFGKVSKKRRFGALLLAAIVSACGNDFEDACQSKLIQASEIWRDFARSSSVQEEPGNWRHDISGEIKGCEESAAVFELPLIGDFSLNHMFAITGQIDVLRERKKKSLLSVEMYMGDREPLLHWSAAWADKDVVDYLLDIGFNVHGGEEKDIEPPIFYAAQNVLDEPEVIALMIERGADSSVAGMGDRTVLHAAVLSKKQKIAEFLMDELGKCPKKEDESGRSAMNLAEERGLKDLVEAMKEYAPDNCQTL